MPRVNTIMQTLRKRCFELGLTKSNHPFNSVG